MIKAVIAVQKDTYISIKMYFFGDLATLEDYLEDKLQIEIDSFKLALADQECHCVLELPLSLTGTCRGEE